MGVGKLSENVGMVICDNLVVLPWLFFLGFHHYMFFQVFYNLFLFFFEGEKSMDGCVDGNCNVPELRICEFCLFPIEDVSGGQTFAPSVV